ncbi:uncharacterized protein LTHEOB_10507 [Lasiodiplodia theobromae]|uniref:uncharacterized protein n=1 Tax=Lasiodiplodia theobromae TaxID=45133 RepID=UPI0015C30083|nr:uncharacterized protein LTHEOB_10507 [Lasiodiplodia theobromae]KAF4539115.1 hypothetical protein LTHEOB_10507 [Lasiodiplodia theobromae]
MPANSTVVPASLSSGAKPYSEDPRKVMDAFRNRTKDALDQILDETNRIQKRMENLANENESNNEREWQQLLIEATGSLAKHSLQQVGDLRQFGTKKLTDANLARQATSSANNTFIGVTNAVDDFYSSAREWLNGAASSLQYWLPENNAAENKIRQFERARNNWHKGYSTVIEGWFEGDDFGHNNGADNFSAIEGLATKLNFMGMENFTIVKKDSGWALELSTE